MASILVVDDEKNIRTLFAEELEEVGHQVVTAAGGAEAVEKFRAQPADLLIVDIRMPDMNGLELVEIIRKLDGSVPIIICSALRALRDDYTLWESNISSFLDKPVDLDDFRSTVQKVLSEAGKA